MSLEPSTMTPTTFYTTLHTVDTPWSQTRATIDLDCTFARFSLKNQKINIMLKTNARQTLEHVKKWWWQFGTGSSNGIHSSSCAVDLVFA